MPMKTAFETFQDCPLLLGLPEIALRQLADIAVLVKFQSNEIIFMENDQPEGLWIVQYGAVKVFKLAIDGTREMILTIERAGQSVAELPILDGGVYPAYASTLEPSALWLLPKEALENVFMTRPNILLHMLRQMGQRLRQLVSLVESLSFQQVLGRLAKHILERSDEGFPLLLENNAVIAARIATVNELVTRNLAKLVNNQLVEVEFVDNKRIITKVDFAGLRQLSSVETINSVRRVS
jgi:CRP-like cAMP-binding protein